MITHKVLSTFIVYIQVMVVRKNGKIFDYVLPHEKVRDDETVTIERVEEVLRELECSSVLCKVK
ncbi:Paratox [Streptococcus agalactiae]|uniref:competence regulator inhibitor paratox n=1 Tax=Streptococcus agalactiae TaxID=1311 RepID=UPI000B766A38|nr:Paratox [Streptococcus agalactiae]OTG58523.1 Paratox [Streptococcus agalactiae]RRA78316.1 Paratox [Streptococcus agalactiae]